MMRRKWIAEALERRTVLDAPDLSPLSIPNLIDQGNGSWTANNPIISHSGTPVLSIQGSVSVTNTTISANGTVSTQLGSPLTLFQGSFSINVGQVVTNALSDAAAQLPNKVTLGGVSLSYSKMSIAATGLTLDATASLPAALGGFTMQATNITIGASGVSAATLGIASPQTFKFDLSGFKLNTSSLSAVYDVPAKKVKLQGMFDAPQLSTQIDLTGAKSITVGEGPTIDFVGGIALTDPVAIAGAWKLTKLDLNVAYQNQNFTVDGTAQLDTGGGVLNLAAAFTTSSFNFSLNGSQDFKLIGMTLDVSQLTFKSDKGNTGSWDPEARFRGTLTLPQALSAAQLTIDQANELVVDSSGVSITGGSISLPGDRTFNALGLLEVKTQNARLDFDFTNREAKLQGTFIVPTLNDFTLDLSGGKFLALKLNAQDELEFSANAVFTVTSLPLFGGWKIDNLAVNWTKQYTDPVGSITAAGTLVTSGNKQIALTMQFENGRLKEISATDDTNDPEFTFLGCSVNIKQLTFKPDINPGNDDAWEPQLELRGGVSLPTAFGAMNDGSAITFEVADPEKFIITESGVDLTGGTISFPNIKFDLLKLVEVQVDGLTITYSSNPGKFRVSGVVSVPQLFGTKLDFNAAQNKYIEIDANGTVNAVGTISIANVTIVPGVWSIKSAVFNFNTNPGNSLFSVTAEIAIPTGISVEGSVQFKNGDLDQIFLAANNINKPLGTTGVFLQRIGGGLENLTNPGGNPGLTFVGTLGITAGPQINIPLPAWAGGDVGGALVAVQATGRINKTGLTINGEAALVGKVNPVSGLATGTMNVSLNWKTGQFKADASLSFFGGLITSNATFKAQGGPPLAASFRGTGALTLPNNIPIVGGSQVASGNGALYYINDFNGNSLNLSNDFCAAWGSVDIPIYGEVTRGFRVFFDGRIEFLTSEVTLPEVFTNTEAAAYDLPVKNTAYLKINWTNGINETALNVQFDPQNGGPLIDVKQTPGYINSITLDPPVAGAKRVLKLSGIVRAGRYIFSIVPPGGQQFQNTTWNLTFPTFKPTLAFTGSSIANLANVTLNYNAADPDSSANINFFYDTDNAGFDGQPIQVVHQNNKKSDVPELDAADTVLWKAGDTGGSQYQLPDGVYYIYARIQDENNEPVFVYLNQPLQIVTNDNPHVLNVWIQSTAWSSSFRTAIRNAGLGTDDGYRIFTTMPGEGPIASTALPWTNLDTIVIQLNEKMKGHEEAVKLLGLVLKNHAITVPEPTEDGKITITLNQPVDRERFTARLAETLKGAYSDIAIDGNNDRTPGDAFNLNVPVLAGDADRNGVVNGADASLVRSLFFTVATTSGYNIFADIDGNGAVNLFDYAAVAQRNGATLPAKRFAGQMEQMEHAEQVQSDQLLRSPPPVFADREPLRDEAFNDAARLLDELRIS